MTKILNQIRSFLASDNALRCLIYLGVIFYARQYFFNRSLWLDEVKVSLCIIKLPIKAFLHQPMLYEQAAPFGFLVVEKLFVTLGGVIEIVLRVFPLLSGVISLWLFARLAKIYLKEEFVFISLLIFIFIPSLIYFSSDVKPYYTDVMVLLLSYVFLAEGCLKELSLYKSIGIGLIGGLLVWFSFPSVLVLSGLGIALILYAFSQKDRTKISRLSIVLFCWFFSSIVSYYMLLNNISRVISNDFFWRDGYVSFKNMNSWFVVFNNILKYPLGVHHFLWLAGLCFLLGVYAFFKEDKKRALLLIAPIAIVCIASGLHKYSCKHRLALFLVPIFILMIVNGIRMISSKIGKLNLIVSFFFIILLFYDSFSFSFDNFIKPKGKEEIRTVFLYVKEHQHQGDYVYFFDRTSYAFKYYFLAYNLHFNHYIEGRLLMNYQKDYLLSDINKIQAHSRVWVIFSHIHSSHPYWAKKIFLNNLDKLGKRIDGYENTGASTYLYDFSKRDLRLDVNLIK